MKKFMKGCAIIALVLVILGFVLAVVAGGMVGSKTISQVVDSVTNGKVQVNIDGIKDWGIDIKDQISGSLDNIIDVDYEIIDATMFDSSFDILSGDVEKYCPGEEIRNLDIEVGGYSFVTKTSDDNSFYLEVESAHKFQGYVKGDTLYIKASVGSAVWSEISSGKITLYVPESFAFDTVDIELGAGVVEFDRLSAGEAALEVGAGRIDISGMEVEQLDVEVGMGECVAEGSVGRSADVECAMGNLELKLSGSEKDFNYRIEEAMGNINLGKDSFSGLAQEKNIDNDASKNMTVECAMGNISIRFAEE